MVYSEMARKELLQHTPPFIDFIDRLVSTPTSCETMASSTLNDVPQVIISKEEYLGNRGSPKSQDLVTSSIDFVSQFHKDQIRHNGNTYLEGHILPVALIAKKVAKSSNIRFGKHNEISALAHDTNEDGYGADLFQHFRSIYGDPGGRVVSRGVMYLSKKGHLNSTLAREFTASDIALGRRGSSTDQSANLKKVKLTDEQYARNLDEIPERFKDEILVIKLADRISNLLEDLWALQQMRKQRSSRIRLDNAKGEMAVSVGRIVGYVNEARTLLYPVFAKRPKLTLGCNILLSICGLIQREVAGLANFVSDANLLLADAFEPVPQVYVAIGPVYRSKPKKRGKSWDTQSIA